MICVCQEDFNIPFTVGAVELGLLYPKHSKYLAKLMINLSSTSKRIKESVLYNACRCFTDTFLRLWFYSVFLNHQPSICGCILLVYTTN